MVHAFIWVYYCVEILLMYKIFVLMTISIISVVPEWVNIPCLGVFSHPHRVYKKLQEAATT